MKKLKKFSEFINETAEFKLPNPSGAGAELAKVLGQNLGVKEVGNNAGADVNKIQRSVGISSGQPWCMAFVYYVFDQFSTKMGVPNPVYKTGSALMEWDKTEGKKITIDEARSDFSLIKPGQIFVATRSGGGHVGIVTGVDQNGKKFTTVEGNTTIKGGGGVSANNRSLNMKSLVGFIDYFPNRDAEFDTSFVNGLKDKVTDVRNQAVDRELPSDAAVGVDPDKEEAEKTNPGGLLGKIVGGAVKYMQMGKGSSSYSSDSDSIDAKTAADAFKDLLK